jgi:hypothetical protein
MPAAVAAPAAEWQQHWQGEKQELRQQQQWLQHPQQQSRQAVQVTMIATVHLLSMSTIAKVVLSHGAAFWDEAYHGSVGPLHCTLQSLRYT